MFPWNMAMPPGGRNLKASWAQVDCGWLCSLWSMPSLVTWIVFAMFGMATSPSSRLEYFTFHFILSGLLDHIHIYLNNSVSILSNRAFVGEGRTGSWHTSWNCRWAFIIEMFSKDSQVYHWPYFDNVLYFGDQGIKVFLDHFWEFWHSLNTKSFYTMRRPLDILFVV